MNKFIVILIITIIMSQVAFAENPVPSPMKIQLQSLDNYIVTLDFKSERTARVSQTFDVVNRYKEPIIPGRAKLVLFKGLDPRNIVISIGGSMKAIPDSDVIEEDGNKVIYYEIWRPISRGEKLAIDVSFDSTINTEGILFKQLSLNFGEPEIPIEKMAFNLILPSGRHVTYSDPPLTLKGENSVLIEIPDNFIEKFQEEPITVEYSSIPLPTLPFHGYWLWLVLIFMSTIIMGMKILSKKEIGISVTS